jgi:hypothetical protein
MGSLTQYADNALLNHVFNTAYSPVATVYLALCTGSPGAGPSIANEVSGGAYARTAISFGAAASRGVTQSAGVTFPKATANWGTVSYYAVMDASSGGNMLASGSFSAGIPVVTGNTLTVASGQVAISIASGGGATGNGIVTGVVNWLLNVMFRDNAGNGSTYTFPLNPAYIALSDTTVTDAASTQANFTEVSGTGYARKAVNKNGGSSPAWTSSTAGSLSNGTTAGIGPPGGTWTAIYAALIVDSSSGSCNVIAYDCGDFTAGQVANNGDTVEFLANQFSLALA